MSTENKITIDKDQIKQYIYFICSIAQNSKTGMHGSLSSKKDHIGGIFDRWINILPENIIFNKHFIKKAKIIANSEKNVSVISDFYIYSPKTVGIAPDVLGIKINNTIIPFVKYDDTQKSSYWVPEQNCPQIEIKSFFGEKYMVSLRDHNYLDKYLVFVNANINTNYLLPFINKDIFEASTLSSLEMPDDFIISNEQNLLHPVTSVSYTDDDLGYISLITTTTANDFIQFALKLSKGDIPRFFIGIEERKKAMPQKNEITHHFLDFYCTLQSTDNNIYRFNDKWNKLFPNKKEKTLDIVVSNPESIKVIGKTKDSIIVSIKKNGSKINGFEMEPNKQYNINFGTLGEVSGEEYFINKYLSLILPNKEDELVNKIATIIANN